MPVYTERQHVCNEAHKLFIPMKLVPSLLTNHNSYILSPISKAVRLSIPAAREYERKIIWRYLCLPSVSTSMYRFSSTTSVICAELKKKLGDGKLLTEPSFTQ